MHEVDQALAIDHPLGGKSVCLHLVLGPIISVSERGVADLVSEGRSVVDPSQPILHEDHPMIRNPEARAGGESTVDDTDAEHLRVGVRVIVVQRRAAPPIATA